MVVLAGYFRFDPELRAEAVEGLKRFIPLARKEQGCIEYSWSQDIEDPNVYRYFEVWESKEHLDVHRLPETRTSASSPPVRRASSPPT